MSGAFLVSARLVLASVFLVAGLTKLFDSRGSREAIVDFGPPRRLAGALGVLLPLTEIAVAVVLIPVGTAWYGALGALALLVLFIAGISYNLARGRTPECHCFGQLHSEPIGLATLLRNGILAVPAIFIVWHGRNDAGLSALTTVERVGFVLAVVAFALLAGEGWLLVNTLRQNGRLIARIEALESRFVSGSGSKAPVQMPEAGLQVGTRAPSFSLSDIHGETLTLQVLLAAGNPVMLTFIDPGCGSCMTLMADIGRWQTDFSDRLTLAVISRGTAKENLDKATDYGVIRVLLQDDREVSHAYRVYGTPSTVLVRPDGTIGSFLAQGADAIRSLMVTRLDGVALSSIPTGADVNVVHANGRRDGTVSKPARRPTVGPRVGQPAPAVMLPGLTGDRVDLANFRGYSTLVLFWNPACGFCQRMLDDLKSWEAKQLKDAPQLVVVSTGDVEVNRAMGLSAVVVLDQDFHIGRMFGATGTPSAVLIDAEGKIASRLAVGAQGVLALLESRNEQTHQTTSAI